jgi:hypothetical protein
VHLIAPVMATHVTLAIRRTSDTGEWPTAGIRATGTGKES